MEIGRSRHLGRIRDIQGLPLLDDKSLRVAIPGVAKERYVELQKECSREEKENLNLLHGVPAYLSHDNPPDMPPAGRPRAPRFRLGPPRAVFSTRVSGLADHIGKLVHHGFLLS